MSRILFSLLAILLTAIMSFAQAPAIASGGVVNGASFRPSSAPGGAIAPGSIVSIFGSNLATQTGAATAVPLPTDIGGTRVTFDNQAAALFFVSAGQINAQVPWTVQPGTRPVVVTRGGVASAAENVSISAVSPGIFSQASNGRGPGAVQNFVSPTDTPINDFSKSVKAGGILVIYATGLGLVENPPATGAAGSGQKTTNAVTVFIGGRSVTPDFAGLTPGFVSLYQVNVRVPTDVPEGCFLPLQLSVAGVVGNTVTIAVAGSGNCSAANTGSVAVPPNVSVGTAVLGRFQTDLGAILPPGVTLPGATQSFNASFTRVEGAAFSATSAGYPPVNGGCVTEVYRISDPKNPPQPGDFSVPPKFLDAGTLTLTAPSGTASTVTRPSTGVYFLNLGSSGFTAGNWRLSGSGGADVGAFGPVTLNIAALFSGSFGVSGTSFSQSQPLTVTWTCPDNTGQVLVGVGSVDEPKQLYGAAVCPAACSAGRFTIGTDVLKQLPPSSDMGALLLMIFYPDAAHIPRITARGLDLGFFTYGDGITRVGLTLTQ